MTEYLDKAKVYKKIAELEDELMAKYIGMWDDDPEKKTAMVCLAQIVRVKFLIKDATPCDIQFSDLWIPYKERKPSCSGEYLTYTEQGFYQVLHYSKEYDLWNVHGKGTKKFAIKDVTHWAPLLPPQKSECAERGVTMDEYISREAALLKLMHDGCSAKKCAVYYGTPSRRRCPGAAWAVDWAGV